FPVRAKRLRVDVDGRQVDEPVVRERDETLGEEDVVVDVGRERIPVDGALRVRRAMDDDVDALAPPGLPLRRVGLPGEPEAAEAVVQVTTEPAADTRHEDRSHGVKTL